MHILAIILHISYTRYFLQLIYSVKQVKSSSQYDFMNGTSWSYQTICRSIHLSLDPWIYLSIHSSIYLSIYLFIYLSIYLSIYKSIYLLIYIFSVYKFYTFFRTFILTKFKTELSIKKIKNTTEDVLNKHCWIV